MKRYVPLRWVLWCALFAFALAFSSTYLCSRSYGQALNLSQSTNAGSIQQNLEHGRLQSPLPSKDGPKLIPEVDKAIVGEITFILERIEYSGNTLLSNNQIDLVLSPYLYKSIDFTQLQVLANAIENTYRRSGAIARVVIPEQKIVEHTMTLLIEESSWGVLKVQGDFTRIDAEQINKPINATQSKGQLLRLQPLERALLIADDLPGVTVSAALSQGAKPSTTDLVLNISDEPLYYSSLQTDNAGPSAIGANRVIGSFGVNSPLGIGDLLNGVYLWSEGSHYGRLSYTLPLAQDGMRAGVNTSLMNYRLVSTQFAGLGATGSSSTLGWEATYPVIRSKSSNLYLGLNNDYRVFSNSNAPSGLLSEYSVIDYSFSIYVNTMDTALGGAANNFNVIVTSGDTNLAGSPNQSVVANSTNAQGAFTKARYFASRIQYLQEGISIYGAVVGQATGANLDPSEMFYLGGVNGVRAYPTNEGAGSEGEIVTIEFRKSLSQTLNLTLFYDYGFVRVAPNRTYTQAGDLNSYDQKGGGLSIGAKPIASVDLKAIWAKRFGADANLTSSGAYQNGSLGSTQLWLVASIGF